MNDDLGFKKKLFRGLDIRGVYPEEINEDVFFSIASALSQIFQPKIVAVGRDTRSSSLLLAQSLISGLNNSGIEAVDIGVVPTEMLYFATGKYGYDLGLMVTASHNPWKDNGLKIVKKGVEPLTEEEFKNILEVVRFHQKVDQTKPAGLGLRKDIYDDYLKHGLSFINVSTIKQLKVLANTNFGPVSRALKGLKALLPVEFTSLNWEPDRNDFKNDPNPLLAENKEAFRLNFDKLSLTEGKSPDLGISWDGDGDRVVFFDEKGNFIPPYFMACLLAEKILKKYLRAGIVFDPRLIWALLETIKDNGGVPIMSEKSGYVFLKRRMKEEKAVFGAESSGHYFFADNFYSDSGLIPFLLVLEALSTSKQTLSEMIASLSSKYFISEEVNLSFEGEIDSTLVRISEKYADAKIDYFDEISVEYPEWRFNLHVSNTEKLLRLNLEARSAELREEKVRELIKFLSSNDKIRMSNQILNPNN